MDIVHVEQLHSYLKKVLAPVKSGNIDITIYCSRNIINDLRKTLAMVYDIHFSELNLQVIINEDVNENHVYINVRVYV